MAPTSIRVEAQAHHKVGKLYYDLMGRVLVCTAIKGGVAIMRLARFGELGDNMVAL
jgi:hypothetical protein